MYYVFAKDADEILGGIIKLCVCHIQNRRETLLWMLLQPLLKAKELAEALVFTGHAQLYSQVIYKCDF